MEDIPSNGIVSIIAQALAEMEEIHGEYPHLAEVPLAKLGCQTGFLSSKL